MQKKAWWMLPQRVPPGLLLPPHHPPPGPAHCCHRPPPALCPSCYLLAEACRREALEKQPGQVPAWLLLKWCSGHPCATVVALHAHLLCTGWVTCLQYCLGRGLALGVSEGSAPCLRVGWGQWRVSSTNVVQWQREWKGGGEEACGERVKKNQEAAALIMTCVSYPWSLKMSLSDPWSAPCWSYRI